MQSRILRIPGMLVIVLTLNTTSSFCQWQLTGNAGTNASTNFVGTTDNKPLVFRVNNKEVVRFKSGAKIDLTNAALSVYIGKNAGLADVTSSPRYNVYIGNEAGSLDGNSDLNVG